MATKIINLDSAYIRKMWPSDFDTAPAYNKALNVKIYLMQLHGAAERMYEKALPLFAKPTGPMADTLLGDVFEIAAKMEAMKEWYEQNEKSWDKEIIDIDEMKRYVDEECEKRHPDFKFVKETK